METLTRREKLDFEAGKDAALAGNLATTRQHLTGIVQRFPKHVAGFYLAKAEYENGNGPTAARIIDAFLNMNPRHVSGLVLSGRIQLQEGNPEKAVRSLEAALALNPEHKGAASVLEKASALANRQNLVELVESIDIQFSMYIETGVLPETLQENIQKLRSNTPFRGWQNDPIHAKNAYFYFAPSIEAALANYDPRLLETSVEFAYLTWPRRMQDHVIGKSVLDVGCGFGGYGTGFLAAGATSYVGLDPEMDLYSTRAKNKRTRTWSDMGISPVEIEARFPAIRLFQGTSEELSFDETFDTISMHNVTEHLIYLEDVLRGLVGVCHSETRLVYLHHNYYCWNGHHMTPHHPRFLIEGDPEQEKFVDWNHIDFAESAPSDHYIMTKLNRVTLKEIREMTERFFVVEQWDEIESQPGINDRLTPAIEDRISRIRPDLTRKDLTVNAIYCVARSKNTRP